MMTSTTTTKRHNDGSGIDGTCATKKIKNVPKMSNTWETALAGDDCGMAHKAISDCCVDKNITTKNCFMMCTNDQRDDGWKETAKASPASLTQKINDMLMVVDSKKHGGDAAMLNNNNNDVINVDDLCIAAVDTNDIVAAVVSPGTGDWVVANGC